MPERKGEMQPREQPQQRTREVIMEELKLERERASRASEFLRKAGEHGMVGASFGAQSDADFTGEDRIKELEAELAALDDK